MEWEGHLASFSSNGCPSPFPSNEIVDAETSHLPSKVRVSHEYGEEHSMPMPRLAGILQGSGARVGIGGAAAACTRSQHAPHHSAGPSAQSWHHHPSLNLPFRLFLQDFSCDSIHHLCALLQQSSKEDNDIHYADLQPLPTAPRHSRTPGAACSEYASIRVAAK